MKLLGGCPGLGREWKHHLIGRVHCDWRPTAIWPDGAILCITRSQGQPLLHTQLQIRPVSRVHLNIIHQKHFFCRVEIHFSGSLTNQSSGASLMADKLCSNLCEWGISPQDYPASDLQSLNAQTVWIVMCSMASSWAAPGWFQGRLATSIFSIISPFIVPPQVCSPTLWASQVPPNSEVRAEGRGIDSRLRLQTRLWGSCASLVQAGTGGTPAGEDVAGQRMKAGFNLSGSTVEWCTSSATLFSFKDMGHYLQPAILPPHIPLWHPP